MLQLRSHIESLFDHIAQQAHDDETLSFKWKPSQMAVQPDGPSPLSLYSRASTQFNLNHYQIIPNTVLLIGV